jgi:hypothetical protein
MRMIFVGISGLVMMSVLGLPRGWVNAQEKPAPAKDMALSKNDRAVLLQTVGLLAASQVYQAYLNVGFIADGKAAGSYAEEDVRQIVESVFKLLAATDKQLEKVAKLAMTPADREGLVRLQKLSSLVRQQGAELQAFWKTGAKQNGDRYENLRQESWRGISALLGLEKLQKGTPIE